MDDSIVVRPYLDEYAYSVIGRNDAGLITITHLKLEWVTNAVGYTLRVSDPSTGRFQVVSYQNDLEDAISDLEDATRYAVDQLSRSAAHRASERAALADLTLPDGSLPKPKSQSITKIFGMDVRSIGA